MLIRIKDEKDIFGSEFENKGKIVTFPHCESDHVAVKHNVMQILHFLSKNS